MKSFNPPAPGETPGLSNVLEALGLPLRLETVREEAGGHGQIGRPHIASALVKKGYVSSINEAFDRYLGTDKPAYVDKYRIGCARAIQIIAGAGGIPVLAHPGLLGIRRDDQFERLIAELKGYGLKGIEGYYPEHDGERDGILP